MSSKAGKIPFAQAKAKISVTLLVSNACILTSHETLAIAAGSKFHAAMSLHYTGVNKTYSAATAAKVISQAANNTI